jgi:glucosamine-6-phosphate deaminase
MEIIIKADIDAASNEAARIFLGQLKRKPASVLGLATGSTPLGLYYLLGSMFERGEADFSRITTFNLDEYVGLPAGHTHSYASYMRENLFSKINVPDENIHIPDGMARDIPKSCEAYEKKIKKAGGIDLQLLGLGSDGHIGFNEPSSSLTSRTRLKTLTEQTINDNARFFAENEEVPRHVITMGIGTIMGARRCMVLAAGEHKARAVAAMVEGAVTAEAPSSILQMHPACTLIIDEPAAALLRRRDYYRWVYNNKPDWQRE